MLHVEGAILAGGRSRRMGRDKALLTLGGRTFLERVSRALHPVVDRVRIVGREEVPDLNPGLGPLSGIHTALATATSDVVLIVACDLPFVTTTFLHGLTARLSDSVQAVVPRLGRVSVPVCAVYRTSCLPALEERIAEGRLGARDFAESLRVRFVEGDELRELDPEGRCLVNVNTPADYEKWSRGRALE